MRLTASLVLYHNPKDQVLTVLRDFFASMPESRLVIIDNSSSAVFSKQDLAVWPQIDYIHSPRNLGFGGGHNLAIKTLSASDCHLLLNPDVSFGADVLPHLLRTLEQHSDIGAVMPKVFSPNGELQRLCRLIPTPLDLLLRRFMPVKSWRDEMTLRYELEGLPQKGLIDVPILSGCFLMIRTELLKRVGGFDERYFLYMEDYDLVRQIQQHARTVYDADVSIIHAHGQGSYRQRHLLKLHLRSACQYFAKWGWWHDADRRQRNRDMLKRLQNIQKSHFI